MKKHLLPFTVLGMLFFTLLPACSKDDDDAPEATKTELLVKSTWKLDKIEVGIVGDITSSFEDCDTDNQLNFTAASTSATSGDGTIDEGPTKCNDGNPQSTPFTWELINDGTVLRTSVDLIDIASGDFNIVSLNSTNLVLSQQIVYLQFPVTLQITLKH